MILGATYLAWMTRLAAFATALAALELLVARRALSDTGVFAWPVLRRDYARPWLADRLFSYRATLVLLATQLVVALALPWFPAGAWLLFATSLAISVRFRGSFNGGSDSMLLVVMLSLAVAHTFPAHADLALGYCALQLALSYVIAGLAKLRDPAWRTGRALAILVELPQYRVPRRLARAAARLTRIASWAILVFELAFPLVLAGPLATTILLAVGAAFHLANALVFGLDRFLWTWLAAYPALLYTLAG
jgi:hypothetical protein